MLLLWVCGKVESALFEPEPVTALWRGEPVEQPARQGVVCCSPILMQGGLQCLVTVHLPGLRHTEVEGSLRYDKVAWCWQVSSQDIAPQCWSKVAFDGDALNGHLMPDAIERQRQQHRAKALAPPHEPDETAPDTRTEKRQE
jgi:hypothetical protein